MHVYLLETTTSNPDDQYRLTRILTGKLGAWQPEQMRKAQTKTLDNLPRPAWLKASPVAVERFAAMRAAQQNTT